jgi:hypothetical protein
MGGRSSSTTNTPTTNTTQDRRQVADNGALAIGADGGAVTINEIDSDTVQAGLSIATRGLDTADAAFQRANETVAEGTKQQTGLLEQVLSFTRDQAKAGADAQRTGASLVKSAYEGATDQATGNRTLIIGGLVAVGVVGAIALASRGK